jgi:heat shock protein HslJ
LEPAVKYPLFFLPLVLAACAATPASDHAAATPDGSQLPRYHWALQQARDRGGARIDSLFARADAPLQLDFSGSRLSVTNSCNRIGSSYSVKGDRLSVGPPMRTLMACPDPKLAAQDDAISARLREELRFSIADTDASPHLQLITASGDTLVFQGHPTAQTRYGSEGETMFLEVAADTRPCSHPLIPNMQCLQVRERHYNADGLADGQPGAWQPLYQDIEGYTHQAGIRNVLRVKRYPLRNVPAGAPSTAYVLDMVVESEVVQSGRTGR